MPIELIKLPYASDALEPHISKKTMEVHYEKHYKKYVATLNQLILGTRFDGLSLENIILDSIDGESAIFHNAAQAWNHIFYWNCMSPSKTESSSVLLAAIEAQFGSFQEFKEKFMEVALGLFGSGWVWLVKKPHGTLSIEASENANTPLTQGDVPILVCDVWEHAYYLDYENDRSEYLKHFESAINWDFVGTNLVGNPSLPREPRPTGDLTTGTEFAKARATHEHYH